MQKLQKGQLLKYPIDLYLLNKHVLSILALGLLISPLYYYGVPMVQADGEWLVAISIWVLISI